MTELFYIEDATDCGSCRVLLVPGDVAYRDRNTGAVGCCIECCADAALVMQDRRESAEFHAVFEKDEVL